MVPAVFDTLQDLMTHNESVTYLMLAGYLILFVCFYLFLTRREEIE
jgi:hypothetical protein